MKRFRLKLNDSGYTLIIVMLTLLVISILGISVLGISANTMKTMTNERDDQSVYYLAEAGLVERKAQLNTELNEILAMAKDEYKRKVDSKVNTYSLEQIYYNLVKENINQNPIPFTNFEQHFGKEASANVTSTVSNEGNSITIESIGKIGESKTRVVEQTVQVSLDPGEPTTEQGGGYLNSCAQGYFGNANSNSDLMVDGDLVLTGDSKLDIGGAGYIKGNIYSFANLEMTNSGPVTGGIYSNGNVKLTNKMAVGSHLLALGNVTLSNDQTINGNLFSNSYTTITLNPKVMGQLYSSLGVNITGQPTISGDIVSKGDIVLSNGQVKATQIISSKNITVQRGSYTNLKKNTPILALPTPINGFTGLKDLTSIYVGSDCTNLMDQNVFKPKFPSVNFQSTNTNLPSNSNLIKFTTTTELHYNEYNYSQWSPINIELPKSNENTVYSLYFNKLNMNNQDINISGNGKLNIYVQDSLALGSIIQGVDSNGKKRSTFDTTVYYFSDVKTSPYLSNWGKKIESNIYIKNSDLNTNGSTINGNIIVLGTNTLTMSGNNTTNGQIVYVPEGLLNATGTANIKGYVVAQKLTSSGRITLAKPSTAGSDSINTDLFERPVSYDNAQILLTPSSNIQELE